MENILLNPEGEVESDGNRPPDVVIRAKQFKQIYDLKEQLGK